jgi:hypothetical protein
MSTTTLLIPWKKSTSDTHVETIKWSQGNSKYEIYISVLEDNELKCVLPHCMDVRTKIEQVVSTEAHLAPSLFRVFPRTISNVLRTIWEVLLQDEDHEETVNGFERCILAFLASHATIEDPYELVAQLRSPQKPREIKVQSFYYRLHEMNGYVSLPPGEEPPLNENQIKQAFFDSMPSTWRERFTQAGHSNSSMILAQVMRYFCQQETLAVRKQIENKTFQHTSSKKFTKGNKKSTSSENHQTDEDRKIHSPARKTFKKSSSTNKRKVLDTDPCPIHDHPHLWGDCRAKYYSQMKKTKTDNSDKSSKKPASAKAAFAVNLTDEEDTDQDSDTVMNEEDDEQESSKF